MYTLTLSKADRDAIDWVGGRYAHGYDLSRVLDDCTTTSKWDSEAEITWEIPEHLAWRIQEICEEDNLTCFGMDLQHKLWSFCGGIV